MGLIPKMQRPENRKITPLTVSRNTQLSPSFRRITLTGPGLTDLQYLGFDQMVRFFFTREDQTELCLPTLSNDAWIAQTLLQPRSRRPWVRNYTIRHFRPDDLELDIDFVRHEDAGPASSWAERAKAGDPAGILDEGIAYLPQRTTKWHLLVGEESAVPAILAILESSPPQLRAEVFLEVPTASDILEDFNTHEGIRLHWIPRSNHDMRPGARVLEEVKNASLPDGESYTWVAGEQQLPTGLRRYLVNDRKIPKSHITFSGYWRQGKNAPG